MNGSRAVGLQSAGSTSVSPVNLLMPRRGLIDICRYVVNTECLVVLKPFYGALNVLGSMWASLQQ